MDGSLRILAVDDEPLARDVVRRYLEADGHEVVSAANGFEAMDIFQSDKFDLVITDHVMPGMTGSQLAATIRNASPKQPIILLTGYSDPAFDLAPAATGVDTVSKTVTRKDLRHAIAKLMGASGVSTETPATGLEEDETSSLAYSHAEPLVR
jgi:CheY-like chemotaxis protein